MSLEDRDCSSPAKKQSHANQAKRDKPFVVDLDARLLKKNSRLKLSRGARSLYGTLRALANGRSGALTIRGNPLDWQYICRQAEVSHCTWRKFRRELLAAGLLWEQRERVTIFKGGRKRVVLGRTTYHVRRQAVAQKIAKKPAFLLSANSSTVEEVAPQITQKHLESSARTDFSPSECLLEPEYAQSSSPTPTPKTDDDFARALLSNSEPESQPDKLTRLQAKAEKTGREAAGREWLAKTGKSQADLDRAFATILSRRRARSLSDPHAWWAAALDRYDDRAVARPRLRNAINSGDPIKLNPAKTGVLHLEPATAPNPNRTRKISLDAEIVE